MADAVVDPTDLPIAEELPSTSNRPTVQLDKAELSPMQFALAALERLGPEAIHTFKLGLLVQLQQVVRQMTHIEARGELVVRGRELLELLARMPWEP